MRLRLCRADVVREDVDGEAVEKHQQAPREVGRGLVECGAVGRRVLEAAAEVGAPHQVGFPPHLDELRVRTGAQPALEPKLPDRVVAIVGQLSVDECGKAPDRIVDGFEAVAAISNELLLGVRDGGDEHAVTRPEVVERVTCAQPSACRDRRQPHLRDRLRADLGQRGVDDLPATPVAMSLLRRGAGIPERTGPSSAAPQAGHGGRRGYTRALARTGDDQDGAHGHEIRNAR